MPIPRRTHDPARPSATPAPRVPLRRPEIPLPARVRGAVTPSRKNRAWPIAIALLALIVFSVAWAQASLVVALIVALAALVAGAMLLTLMFGTTWIIQPRRRAQELPRYR
jgi:Flp pilus assembly protein TadB